MVDEAKNDQKDMAQRIIDAENKRRRDILNAKDEKVKLRNEKR